jgi:histidinol dehydrogenase
MNYGVALMTSNLTDGDVLPSSIIASAKTWQRPQVDADNQIENNVRDMLQKIQTDGDQAIIDFAQQFDGQTPQVIELKPFEQYIASNQISVELGESIKLAAKRIEKFAAFQMQGFESRSFSDEFGTYGQQVAPIERVGAYIPGGRYPLISTALMTLIPAKVAGCSYRLACSPSAHPAILAAASLAGATEFIQLGGVQAIAAMTYGFKQLEPVDLVVGPGNAWVNEAKKQLQSQVKIDGLAGPSELLILADKQQKIDWLALDALAQAEHDPMACSIIVCDDLAWLKQLENSLQIDNRFKPLLDNNQVALVLADSVNQMITLSETYASEHLMLCHSDIKSGELTHYGSLFVGANSAVALGDYISGPNHTLPTLGYARQTGGLSVSTYVRLTTTQAINDLGRNKLSQAASVIADAEGLVFHKQSLDVRQD